MVTFVKQVGEFIRDHEGCTGVFMARILKPKDTATYGYQRQTSRAIAELRRMKLVEDVAARCPHCRRALTRHLKNVPLRLTADGRAVFGPTLF